MPSCVVRCCRNHTSGKKKPGITFHRFPGDEIISLNWIRLIRESRNDNDWNPSKSSVVCSVHFEAKEIYATRNGRHRVSKFAVPKKKLSMIEAITGQHTSDSEQSCSENVNTNTSSIEVITGHEKTLEQSCSQNLNSSLLKVPRIQEEQADEAEIFYMTLNQHQTLEQASSQNSYFCLNQSLPNAVSPPEQSLPLLRERFLKYKLTKLQKVTQNQKKKIQSLNQKVKRVQNRNKRLIDMLKTLKKRINLI